MFDGTVVLHHKRGNGETGQGSILLNASHWKDSVFVSIYVKCVMVLKWIK